MANFNDNLRKRLSELRSMTNSQRQSYLRQLNASSPIKPWPFGIPCSAAPEVVVVGISPGNTPRKEDKGFVTLNKSGKPPTFGKPHGGFSYRDPKHYWAKVCSLCCHFVRRSDSKMSDDGCIALSSHLNLGTGQAGEASVEDADRATTRWVSTLLNKFFQPRLIVCFGLNQILKARFDDWNCRDGLQVDWRKPKAEHLFDSYHFRLWEAISAKGKRIGVLMWPNHPSRHPFGGDENGLEWKRSLTEANLFLAANNF